MIAAATLLLLTASADVAIERAALVRRTRELMHTNVTIAVAGEKPSEKLDEAFGAAFAVFEQIERDLNEWREGSALQQVNAGAGGTPIEAPPLLCDVLKLALDGARRTKGLFDPTWAALRDVWSFKGEPEAPLPDPAKLKAACALVSYRDVELKPLKTGGCTVRLKKKGMALGLGGLVKGWGVDRATAELKRRGFPNHFVQAGGDLYLSGVNGDRPWKVGIRDPRGGPETSFARGELSNTAFSTSGDYERFFFHQGVRYHHIIDLRSCEPARASVSATVMAKSALDAELLTKSVFILGPAGGLELARSFGASAVIVDPKGRVHLSRGLEGTLEVWPPSGFGGDAGSP